MRTALNIAVGCVVGRRVCDESKGRDIWTSMNSVQKGCSDLIDVRGGLHQRRSHNDELPWETRLSDCSLKYRFTTAISCSARWLLLPHVNASGDLILTQMSETPVIGSSALVVVFVCFGESHGQLEIVYGC